MTGGSMFIEFQTASGRTLLNVRHIVQVTRTGTNTEIVLVNGGVINVTASYQDVYDSIERLTIRSALPGEL
jgi:uncharacterized protein YlzI (FlbEa/FlbD family)